MQQFADPAVIIGLLTALGAGTIIQQLLNRRKTSTDVDLSLTAMAREVAAELRQDNQELRSQLDRTEAEVHRLSDRLDAVLDLVAHEKRWARINGHDNAPVLQPLGKVKAYGTPTD